MKASLSALSRAGRSSMAYIHGRFRVSPGCHSPLSSRTQELHLASQRATLAESVQAVAEEAKAAAASGAGPATRGESAAEEATGTEGVMPTLKLKSGGRRALSSSSPADSPRSHRAAQVGEQRL